MVKKAEKTHWSHTHPYLYVPASGNEDLILNFDLIILFVPIRGRTYLTHTWHWLFDLGLSIPLQIWTHFKIYNFHAIYDLFGTSTFGGVSMGCLLIYLCTMYVIVRPSLHVITNAHTHIPPTPHTNKNTKWENIFHHDQKRLGWYPIEKCFSYFSGLL